MNQKLMKTIPLLRKRHSGGWDDVPGRDDDKSHHPPAIIVIVHAGEKSVMTMFAEVYYSPMKNLGGVKVRHVRKGWGFPRLRAQLAKVGHHLSYRRAYLCYANLIPVTEL